MVLVRFLLKSRDGATAIEYALIAALVSVAIIGSLGNFAGAFESTYTLLATKVSWGP